MRQGFREDGKKGCFKRHQYYAHRSISFQQTSLRDLDKMGVVVFSRQNPVLIKLSTGYEVSLNFPTPEILLYFLSVSVL